MLPPAHPAVAYLLYSGLRRATGEVPGGPATLALLVGGLLPDLVDQPLYYAVGTPSTRTLGHSLLVAVPVCIAVVAVVHRSALPRRVAAGFVVGYLVHVATDAGWPLALALHDELGYLLWPLTPSPPYSGEKALVDVAGVTVTSYWVDAVFLAVGVVAWWRDGRPGLEAVRGRFWG